MRFSIIIPVYNVEQYLRDCLDSVLGQTLQDWEAICVNDGSTDNSEIILSEYATKDSRIKVVSKANGGLSSARNSGLEKAAGEYVLFLDSDDWLEVNALQAIANNIEDEDLLCFNGRRYFEESRAFEQADLLAEESFSTGWDYYCQNALKSRRFAFVCVVLRCYRRQYLLENGLHFKPGIYHEDNLFTPYACYYAKKTKVITDVLYNYRVRVSSIMTSRSLKHWIDIVQTANELAGFFESIEGLEKSIVYRSLTHHYQVALDNVSANNDKELRSIVDWRLYKAVSRTKLRHRILYFCAKISTRLFKAVNRLVS